MRIFDKLHTIKNRQRNIFLRPGDCSVLENFEAGDFLSCVEVAPNKNIGKISDHVGKKVNLKITPKLFANLSSHYSKFTQ
jgi:hypothetical protein